MNLDEMINSMTPEVYQRLSTAVELGKWPDGVALTAEQKENCLQLVMLWQARNNIDAQHMTIDTNGEMVMKSKQQLKVEFGITPEPIATFKSFRSANGLYFASPTAFCASSPATTVEPYWSASVYLECS